MIHGQPANDESVLWKDRYSWYPHLRRLEVVGGEPLYIKKWHQIFNELIEGGYAKDIVLDMSSNANIFLKDELYYWADNFKRVGIGLSVDGTGAVYDYMRSGGNWFKVLNNMDKYHNVMKYYRTNTGNHNSKYNSEKLFVQVSFTLSWLNALELPKIHKIVRDNFPLFKIWNNLVYAPEWMSLRYAPQELKDLIKQNWSEFDWGKYQKDIDGFINFMNLPSADENTFKYFMSKSDSLDVVRKDSLFNAVPEYKDILKKYVSVHRQPYSQINTIPIVEVK
jgi:sulfatase maturation enzyme AslB (radical SAM superfamily)